MLATETVSEIASTPCMALPNYNLDLVVMCGSAIFRATFNHEKLTFVMFGRMFQ